MKKSNKIPKYPSGGVSDKDKTNVENFFGNNLKAIGDIGLSTLGLDNVIKDSDYKGTSAKGFRQYSDIAGGLGKAILPTAANALLPGSGSFVKSGQQLAGNFNPEDNSLNQYDSNGNLTYQEQRNTKQLGNMLGSAGMSLGSSMGVFAMGGINNIPNAIPQYPNGGKIPKLKPRDFKAEKAHYEEQTRGANQADGSGISSAELAYRYSKLIDPTGATSAVEISKNFYNGNPQDPIDYLGLVKVPFVSQGMKPLSKLAKQGNKASVLINTITKTNDVAESFRAGGMMGDKYGNGGAVPREFANSEVELEENTLNPDGSTTQFNGPSHEAGGIPTNLDKGTMIFSDKLKHNGKTFAHLNKVNMTHKEDKILDDKKSNNISKLTANLMKQAKNKSSEQLFEKQESLKQERVEKYIKRLGGIMKYPNGGTSGQTLNDNSIVAPSIGQDPRYYTYQGNQVMKPGLRALNKDSGVTTDIGMDNYNQLLNTRAQVQNSKVNVNNQLPKFEYINDSSKGDYNTQFENYKKVNVGYFRAGGQLPKFDEGTMFGYNPKNNVDKMKIQQGFLNNQNQSSNSSWLTPEMIQSSSDQFVEEGYNPSNKINNSNTNPSKSMGSKTDQELYDAELAKMNSSVNSNKFDWKGLGTQALSFAANNAGNLYDLKRSNENETRKYERMTANLLDPTAALRDAEAQTRRAEYNVRGASGGNAGTYLSNRVALNTQNTINKARINTDYQNANAGIKNEVGKINTSIANEEILANAKIRANGRNIKQSDIASTGSNVANQMNDIRNTEMDKKRIDNLIKMYPSLSKDPEMLKYLTSFK